MGQFKWQDRENATLRDGTDGVRADFEDVEMLEADNLGLIQMLGFKSLDSRDDTFGILI